MKKNFLSTHYNNRGLFLRKAGEDEDRIKVPKAKVFGKKVHDPGTPKGFQFASESERIDSIPEDKRTRLFLHNVHDADGNHIGYQWHGQILPNVGNEAGFRVSPVLSGTRSTDGVVSRIEHVDNLHHYGIVPPTGIDSTRDPSLAPYVVRKGVASKMLDGGRRINERGLHSLATGEDWDKFYSSPKGTTVGGSVPYDSRSGDMVHLGGHSWNGNITGKVLHTQTAHNHGVDPEEFFGKNGENLSHSLRVYGTPDGAPSTLGAWRAMSEARTFSGYKPGGSVPLPKGLASQQGHAKLKGILETSKGADTSMRPDGTHQDANFGGV